MKKIFAMLLIAVMLSVNFSSVFAEKYWSVVSKDTLPMITGVKEGNYYFKGSEDGKLLYSTDGINFFEVQGIEANENKPGTFRTSQKYSKAIYSHGLYFVISDETLTMPQNMIPHGSTNTPMYILDENLNIINIIEGRYWAGYNGYYGGYHYVFTTTYSNNSMSVRGTTSNTTIYKTTDGINLTPTTYEERRLIPEYEGKELYNGDILGGRFYEDDDETNILIGSQRYKVLQENDGFIRMRNEDENVPLLVLSYKIGEETIPWIDGRMQKQGIYEYRLSLDGIYGVVMPENIGTYRFELNGNYYFDIEDDEASYYCIPKSALIDKIKVVYGDSILAFNVAPVTESNRTLVPMRFLFEQMGAEVAWNAETNTATVTKGEETISFSIDNTEATVNGEIKTMDVPARLIENKTMIPVRFLSEELGYTVGWDEETKIVTISDN